jgi:type VI secretion system secreted protein VgrG
MTDQPSASDFIQASRVLKVMSPLGEDVLLPERLTLEEGVSSLFSIELAVRAKRDVKPDELIGKLVDVGVEVDQGNGIRRPFNGLVTELQEGPPVTRGLRAYTLMLRPQLWLLSQRSDCRIWMDQTALQVVETLLAEHGIPAADTSGVIAPPPPQHYSVQWNETDLGYLTRRLEEDGLFYWFSHKEGEHRLHVADHASGWLGPSEAARGEARVRLAQGSSDRNHINDWGRRYSYVPGQRAGADWNFETPKIVPKAATPSLVSLPDNNKRELYEYPARALTMEAAERQKKLRMQASEADHDRVFGGSNVRVLEAGRRFTPYEEAHPDRKYEEHVLVKARHRVVDRSYETNSNEPEYQNTFEAVPSRVSMTPHRATPRPRIDGTHIGIIAGPPGEEIHVDKYGRVKLWFPWDRRAKKDGSDTKWVEVVQSWGGGTWGARINPRIGMQAICSHENGDPDRPYVIGLVANADNMVPYDLPTNKTRTVLRSNTYKGTGFNEYSTEDAPGRENQFFHAQKDQTTRVLNNRTKRVDSNEVASIGANRAVEVGGNQKHEIGGSMNLTVGGTGAGALGLMTQVAGLAGHTAGLLQQAGQIAGGGGAGLGAFATTLASSALGFLGLGGLKGRDGVVLGPNPRADQGTDLAASGASVGDDASSLFPLSGIMNTVVGNFKSDTVGIARAEQIGVSKVTNVGVTSLESVGKYKKIAVGEEFVIEVGDSKFIMKSNGEVIILGKTFNFVATEHYQMRGKPIDMN